MKLDPEFFVPARKFDRFVTPPTRRAVEELESLTGVSISNLNGLKQAMEKSFAQSVAVCMAVPVRSIPIAGNSYLEWDSDRRTL